MGTAESKPEVATSPTASSTGLGKTMSKVTLGIAKPLEPETTKKRLGITLQGTMMVLGRLQASKMQAMQRLRLRELRRCAPKDVRECVSNFIAFGRPRSVNWDGFNDICAPMIADLTQYFTMCVESEYHTKPGEVDPLLLLSAAALFCDAEIAEKVRILFDMFVGDNVMLVPSTITLMIESITRAMYLLQHTTVPTPTIITSLVSDAIKSVGPGAQSLNYRELLAWALENGPILSYLESCTDRFTRIEQEHTQRHHRQTSRQAAGKGALFSLHKGPGTRSGVLNENAAAGAENTGPGQTTIKKFSVFWDLFIEDISGPSWWRNLVTGYPAELQLQPYQTALDALTLLANSRYPAVPVMSLFDDTARDLLGWRSIISALIGVHKAALQAEHDNERRNSQGQRGDGVDVTLPEVATACFLDTSVHVLLNHGTWVYRADAPKKAPRVSYAFKKRASARSKEIEHAPDDSITSNPTLACHQTCFDLLMEVSRGSEAVGVTHGREGVDTLVHVCSPADAASVILRDLPAAFSGLERLSLREIVLDAPKLLGDNNSKSKVNKIPALLRWPNVVIWDTCLLEGFGQMVEQEVDGIVVVDSNACFIGQLEPADLGRFWLMLESEHTSLRPGTGKPKKKPWYSYFYRRLLTTKIGDFIQMRQQQAPKQTHKQDQHHEGTGESPVTLDPVLGTFPQQKLQVEVEHHDPFAATILVHESLATAVKKMAVTRAAKLVVLHERNPVVVLTACDLARYAVYNTIRQMETAPLPVNTSIPTPGIAAVPSRFAASRKRMNTILV